MLDTIKQVALNAVEQSKPVKIVFGVVISVNPLKIQLEQKLILEKKFFILTENSPECAVGDKLVMLRAQEGQSYLILDKVVS